MLKSGEYMKIVIAPDSFKGSLSAESVAEHIEKGILKAGINCNIVKIPIADGGEGTVKALVRATGGRVIKKTVKDPLMRDIESFYGVLGDGVTAVVELSAASGITLLQVEDRNPMFTTTYGTGQLIDAAILSGYKRIIIGLGGSATNDGGAGLLYALGVKFYDGEGGLLLPCGGNIDNIKRFDAEDFYRKFKDIKVIVANDVDNLLCGDGGASKIFAPQKGAEGEMIEELDKKMETFGKFISSSTKIDILNFKGAGAAGGAGGGIKAFMDPEFKQGVEVVLEYAGLENEIRDADLVITGEGKIDAQTLHGKAPYGVAKAAIKYGVPVIAIAGDIGEQPDKLYEAGFYDLYKLMTPKITLKYAIENAGELLEETAEELIKKFALNM
jgi:glycerate 2-kinase